jgi:hypothetical protein
MVLPVRVTTMANRRSGSSLPAAYMYCEWLERGMTERRVYLLPAVTQIKTFNFRELF